MSFVQYGCGLSAPPQWINFDASPSLRIQKIPMLGGILGRSRVQFPQNVRYGNVTKGLPLADSSCDAVFASHVLEHLALDEFYIALDETLRIMKPGAKFRAIVPDLKTLAEQYLLEVQSNATEASHRFMRNACLGQEYRPKGLKAIAVASMGNSEHLWMWDINSLSAAVISSGFSSVRSAKYGDSEEHAFSYVENRDRFVDAIAIEASK